VEGRQGWLTATQATRPHRGWRFVTPDRAPMGGLTGLSGAPALSFRGPPSGARKLLEAPPIARGRDRISTAARISHREFPI